MSANEFARRGLAQFVLQLPLVQTPPLQVASAPTPSSTAGDSKLSSSAPLGGGGGASTTGSIDAPILLHPWSARAPKLAVPAVAVPKLSDIETDRIKRNEWCRDLYKFIEKVAAKDRHHNPKNGQVYPMNMALLWNMEAKSVRWGLRRDLTKDNFEKQYDNWITGDAHAAIENALSTIRECSNPEVRDITLLEIIRDTRLTSFFVTMVGYRTTVTTDASMLRSTAKEAINVMHAEDGEAFEFFLKVRRQVTKYNTDGSEAAVVWSVRDAIVNH